MTPRQEDHALVLVENEVTYGGKYDHWQDLPEFGTNTQTLIRIESSREGTSCTTAVYDAPGV